MCAAGDESMIASNPNPTQSLPYYRDHLARTLDLPLLVRFIVLLYHTISILLSCLKWVLKETFLAVFSPPNIEAKFWATYSSSVILNYFSFYGIPLSSLVLYFAIRLDF